MVRHDQVVDQVVNRSIVILVGFSSLQYMRKFQDSIDRTGRCVEDHLWSRAHCLARHPTETTSSIGSMKDLYSRVKETEFDALLLSYRPQSTAFEQWNLI